MDEETQKLNAFGLKANRAVALSKIIRLSADLESREMGAVSRALTEYIAACNDADTELERELSEVGALIGAATTLDEARLLMSQLLAYVRSGRRANRKPKPLRKFALVGGKR